MKSITIAGRLTRDAEIRTTNNGDRLASFSVAVDDRSSREKATLFFDCTLFGKRGEALAPHLTKGSPVCVSGDLGTREHNGKTYLGVRADNVTLLGKAERGGGGGDDGFRNEGSGGVSGGGGNRAADLDDDIPFARPAGLFDRA